MKLNYHPHPNPPHLVKKPLVMDVNVDVPLHQKKKK